MDVIAKRMTVPYIFHSKGGCYGRIGVVCTLKETNTLAEPCVLGICVIDT